MTRYISTLSKTLLAAALLLAGLAGVAYSDGIVNVTAAVNTVTFALWGVVYAYPNGITGDGVVAADASIASGSPTMTSASKPCLSAYTGFRIELAGAGAADGSLPLDTTISGCSGSNYTLGAVSANSGALSAMMFGAASDQSAVLKALVLAYPQAQIQLPSGVIGLYSTTIPLDQIAMQGTGVISPTLSNGLSSVYTLGTSFIVLSKTLQPFTIRRSVHLSDFNIFYPGQYGVTANPVVYPALFADDGTHSITAWYMERVSAINPYDFFTQAFATVLANGVFTTVSGATIAVASCPSPTPATGSAIQDVTLNGGNGRTIGTFASCAANTVTIQGANPAFASSGATDSLVFGSAPISTMKLNDLQMYCVHNCFNIDHIGQTVWMRNIDANANAYPGIASLGPGNNGYLTTWTGLNGTFIKILGGGVAGGQCDNFDNIGLQLDHMQAHGMNKIVDVVGGDYVETEWTAFDGGTFNQVLTVDAGSRISNVNYIGGVFQANGGTAGLYAVDIESTCTGGSNGNVRFSNGIWATQAGVWKIGGNSTQQVVVNGNTVTAGTLAGAAANSHIMEINDTVADIAVTDNSELFQNHTGAFYSGIVLTNAATLTITANHFDSVNRVLDCSAYASGVVAVAGNVSVSTNGAAALTSPVCTGAIVSGNFFDKPSYAMVTKYGAIGKVTAGTAACAAQACTATGTGYGNAQTGTLTLTTNGGKFVCSTYPVLNVTTNAGGNVTTVNSVTTAGSCTTIGATTDEVWTAGAPLSAGSSALFLLTWSNAGLNATWTAAAGLQKVDAWLVGAGGQGGGGANVTSGTASSGGAGGGGGNLEMCSFNATQAGASQTVTIGLGGRSGGKPGPTASSSGTIGQSGGTTTFGGLCKAFGGGAGFNGINAATASGGGGGAGPGGGGGDGGSASAGSAGAMGGGAGGTTGNGVAASAWLASGGGGGGNSSGAAQNGGSGMAGGGASGGGLTTGPATATGGNGGTSVTNGLSVAGGTGGAANNSGNVGGVNAGGLSADMCSGAGGGGSALTTTVAGNGASGCIGSGGGGGGSAVSGTASAPGWGGPGGDGEAYIVQYF